MKQQYLYWYHLDTQTDPFSEGYIGITSDINKRHTSHKCSITSKQTHFVNAIKKYSIEKMKLDILHIKETREEIGALEYAYRPVPNMGWNMIIGGDEPLSHHTVSVSLYHKDSYPILHTFDSIKEATEALGMTKGRISQALNRGTTSYGYDGWALLIDAMIDRSSTKTIQEVLSKALTGRIQSKPSHFKGITDRWSDKDKQRISRQHKGKTISEKQKKITSEKNSKNPNLCKRIVLKHIDNPTILHEFHSISEAAKQLDLPLSRLKSKAQRPLNKYGKDNWAVHSLGSG